MKKIICKIIITCLLAVLSVPALYAQTKAYISKETGFSCRYPVDWKHCTANEYPQIQIQGNTHLLAIHSMDNPYEGSLFMSWVEKADSNPTASRIAETKEGFRMMIAPFEDGVSIKDTTIVIGGRQFIGTFMKTSSDEPGGCTLHYYDSKLKQFWNLSWDATNSKDESLLKEIIKTIQFNDK